MKSTAILVHVSHIGAHNSLRRFACTTHHSAITWLDIWIGLNNERYQWWRMEKKNWIYYWRLLVALMHRSWLNSLSISHLIGNVGYMRCIFLSILLLFRDVIARRLFVFLFVCSVSVSLSHDIIRSLVGWFVG